MENRINEQEMLNVALESIESFCKSYASKEMDQEAFCKALADIPETLWKEKTSSLSMLSALAENDDLYRRYLGWLSRTDEGAFRVESRYEIAYCISRFL